MDKKLLISRESYRFTAALWLAVPLLGAVPYLVAGVVPSFTDALFESVSGFTTTGSSVIETPEALPAWLRIAHLRSGALCHRQAEHLRQCLPGHEYRVDGRLHA